MPKTLLSVQTFFGCLLSANHDIYECVYSHLFTTFPSLTFNESFKRHFAEKAFRGVWKVQSSATWRIPLPVVHNKCFEGFVFVQRPWSLPLMDWTVYQTIMPFQITERLKWKRLRVTSIFFSLIFQFPPPFATDLVVPRQIVRPQCALIVVDVQNDFISGSLAIDEVRKCNTLSLWRGPWLSIKVPCFSAGWASGRPYQQTGRHRSLCSTLVSTYQNNSRLKLFQIILVATKKFRSMLRYSLDWHPADHVSFFDNVHLRPLATDCKV